MRRLLTGLAALSLTACAVNMGAPSDIPVTAVAVEAANGATAATVGQALQDAQADVALVTAGADSAWFRQLAGAADLQLSGPARLAGDSHVAFLGGEALGDTTLELTYDGGRFVVHDALYELKERRFLDLLAFRADDPATVRRQIGSLLEYVASDVMNSAAVVMAVTVPDPAVGDSVARMLSPGYFDALRCAGGEQDPGTVRLFYGPEARMYCREARTRPADGGGWVVADLVMGRRR
jgi:hypothetical protein